MASLTSGSHIYTGAWIDWSKGVLAGTTITLDSRTGAVLTAFLALFVTVIGACLWRIVCFVAHQFFATADARDGIFHQHQLIFRNTGSAAAAGVAFFENAFSWRKTGMKSWSRSLPLAGFATLFMLGFGVASLLTSLVTKSAGSSRLVVSDNCGFFAINDTGRESNLAMGTKDLADTITASIYARTCYGNGSSAHGLQCNLFTKKALNYTKNIKATCPFGDNLCSTNAISMDTNRLSSQLDFGINTPDSGRIDFRKVTTCSPLYQKGYVKKTVADGKKGLGAFNDTISHYQYGGWPQISEFENDTWVYNQHAFVDNFGYQFEALIAYAGNSTSQSLVAWTPIPALSRDNADTTIMFLAPNAIRFNKPNSDPFFHANFKVPLNLLGQDMSYWLSDEWVNVMACTDQYQICNPLLPDATACTPLVGNYGLMSAVSKIGLNKVQDFVAMMIYYNTRATSMYYSIYNRGSGALRAQETVNLLDQSPLPNDQWQTEVSSWFDTALAKLQRNIMSFAAGPENVVQGAYTMAPIGDVGKSMCYSQKVNTTSDSLSFSVLGMAIILTVGALIIAIWLVLETAVAFFQRKYQWGDYRRLRWIMDDKMQLQRMAFEEAGMGNWTKLSSNVPVTEKNQVFGGLGHVDPEMPRLGEKWASDEKRTGLAAAAAAAAESTSHMTSNSDGRLSPMPTAMKKDGVNVYERPVYQPVTPPLSQNGH